MRDRTELTPITTPEPTALSRPKVSVDVDTLPLSECRALILKQREELYFKTIELSDALNETKKANLRANQMQMLAEEIGRSLRGVSEYARAAAAETRKRGMNDHGGII